MIGGEYFPYPGDIRFFVLPHRAAFCIAYLSTVNTGWHHEKIVPGILAIRPVCPGFLSDFNISKENAVMEKQNMRNIIIR